MVDERHCVTLAQMRQHQGRRGVASDHHEIGSVVRNQRADQSHHARDQRRFLLRPVGKKRIVGHIDKRRVRPRALDLAQDGEATEAGVKDQNGRRGPHVGRASDRV
jgi:hypothetical protein